MEDQKEKMRKIRARRLRTLRARERLTPCLRQFDKVVSECKKNLCDDPIQESMSRITDILRGTYTEVLGQIADSGKEGISAINAVKRSAGTNFQGLCEYAILSWIDEHDLPLVAGPNAPKGMKEEFTIHGVDADAGEFSVEPDIDISIWSEDQSTCNTVLFLSAKTSLVDRAGQAARWKLYLDLHQTTCPHTGSIPDCPIHRTKVRMRTDRKIIHGLVTANIYKIDTTQPQGELESGQCRNNTYMFSHKFTTRNDDLEARPPSWRSFSEFPDLIRQSFLEVI